MSGTEVLFWLFIVCGGWAIPVFLVLSYLMNIENNQTFWWEHISVITIIVVFFIYRSEYYDHRCTMLYQWNWSETKMRFIFWATSVPGATIIGRLVFLICRSISYLILPELWLDWKQKDYVNSRVGMLGWDFEAIGKLKDNGAEYRKQLSDELYAKRKKSPPPPKSYLEP